MTDDVRIVSDGGRPENAASSASSSASQPAPLSASGRRRHPRVVRRGTEWFDADGVKLDPEDLRSEESKDRDDDRRILDELPPHWGVFSERKQAGA
ncbi:hypothetical protein PSRA_0247 [Pseudoscardovia radai]|uniref:Superfamily I DNA and RNA helicase n=1 Tax=Pseudoscardovia radai TaxID=987066 RepID=A0A261F0A7_9BIFI|nr:hypothetical protein PSRA_0247 [Pseudoscardovia radai]